jgi:hypothetical protein
VNAERSTWRWRARPTARGGMPGRGLLGRAAGVAGGAAAAKSRSLTAPSPTSRLRRSAGPPLQKAPTRPSGTRSALAKLRAQRTPRLPGQADDLQNVMSPRSSGPDQVSLPRPASEGESLAATPVQQMIGWRIGDRGRPALGEMTPVLARGGGPSSVSTRGQLSATPAAGARERGFEPAQRGPFRWHRRPSASEPPRAATARRARSPPPAAPAPRRSSRRGSPAYRPRADRAAGRDRAPRRPARGAEARGPGRPPPGAARAAGAR